MNQHAIYFWIALLVMIAFCVVARFIDSGSAQVNWSAVLVIATFSFVGQVAWPMIAAKRYTIRRILLLFAAVGMAAAALAALR